MHMMKNKSEIFFSRLGQFLYKHRRMSFVFLITLLVFMLFWISRLSIDTSFERELRKDDIGLIQYNQFRNQFGHDKIIIIAVQTSDIFNVSFLDHLKSFHKELEKEVPHIKKIVSLLNATHIYGKEDEVIVENLLEQWPENDSDLDGLKRKIMDTPRFLNSLIADDGHTTTLVLETRPVPAKTIDQEELLNDFEEESEDVNPSPKKHNLSEKEISETINAINTVSERYKNHDFVVALTGSPVIENAYNQVTRKDMGFLLVVATINVGLFLMFLFRRISGILLPFIIVYSSLFSTLGLMALTGVSITQMTTVLPTFLVVVGTADSVHLLSSFYRNFNNGYNIEESIVNALCHSGPAIVMTSLTTITGLLSFSFSELSTIGELGLFSAAGVFFALFNTIFLLPVLLSIVPFKRMSHQIKVRKMDRMLLFIARFSYSHPKKIVFLSAVFFLFSIVFIFKLQFFLNMITYFPDKMDVKKDLIIIEKKLKGTRFLEVVIDTKIENGICDPHLLNKIDHLSKSIEKISDEDLYVGKIFSITDIIKETNRALHDNNPEYYIIPKTRDAVAQVLFLFENSGSKELGSVVDSQFSKTRVTIKIPWIEMFLSKKFITQIKQRYENVFHPIAEITVTGSMVVLARTVPIAMQSMGKSYVTAFLIITLMMIILVGNFNLGLLSMIPNLFPIFLVMGLMGFLKVPLDLTSLMIGSIAIGLVVDDTMHFIYHFKEHYRKTKNVESSIRETMLDTGKALLITTLVLSSGFFVGALATLKNLVIFGIFTGLTIVLALLADFLLLPALLVLFEKRLPNYTEQKCTKK